MTAIGKMLLFMVLVLSLVFNGLVVNAYVTRSNWKKLADEQRATAKKAAEAVKAMQKLLEEERAATADALRRAREERYQYEQLYQKEKTAAESFRATVTKSLVEARKDNTTQISAQALADSLQKQVDDLSREVTRLLEENNNLVKQREIAITAKEQAEIEANAQQKRANQLEVDLRRATDLIQQYKTGGRPTLPGELRAAAPEGFRGTVRTYQDGYVAFTPGLDAGLQKNATLKVYRLQPEPKYLGRVVVIQVDPKEAVGRFIPAQGSSLTPSGYPQPGDELTSY
jgi:hypothetical protein